MDLRDYLRVLRKGWPLILAFVVLGLAAGIGLTLSTTKVYEASSQVYIAASSSSSDAAAQGQTFAEGLAQNAPSFVSSPSVLKPVISTLGLKMSLQTLKGEVSADAPLNKTLVNLHVSDTDPQRAARIANVLTQEFNRVVASKSTLAQGRQFTKLSVTQPATVPSAPIKPNKVLNIGLGFVVGLLVGVGLVVLRDVLDSTIKSPADFEEYGVPAMGVVPFDKRTASSPVAFRADATGARSEAYRQIRTNLQFVDVDNPPKIISITSAVPGEGKSTTALNLAAALAEAGSRVCLIEADLRRPSLARVLGLVGDVGFTTTLIGKTPVEEVLQNAGQNLAVLTSGPIPPNPSELLITEHAKQIIDEVAGHVDFVVVDTPPLLPVTDGATVATLADATLLVARPGKTSREQAERSIDALEKVGKRPVGVVLNMVTRGRGGYSYEYGYYYTAARGTQRPRRLGRSEVGVASGHDSPDAADDSLAVLDNASDAHAPEADPYRPAHAGQGNGHGDVPLESLDDVEPERQPSEQNS
ncbi:polysaccharide biosynthesis tyrosine autokinase [Jatrophihabitans endophyticus]|uniref:polysaccharide biosynthesis tyrosine autokinase n=1 Tax=Jatrophihabitans endophyticus TaxID=1206085 RepID=UPI0019FA7419|nr:polysaccharide biosynthesis tyrosine autokinase [Jatrophihabitans endophyticus]MBE7189342.1 polysaccharide biosynthesis tyrosine autokinase [Jatrophihabitans endophyticus]